MVCALHHRAANEGFGFDNAQHRRKLVAAILHSNRANDGTDGSRCEIECDKFADIGQLDNDHIILADPCRDQRTGVSLHFCLQIRIGQPPWLTKSEVGAIGCIDQRHSLRMRLHIGKKQVCKGLVTPPTCFAISASFLFFRDDHVRLRVPCSVPCRCHHHWPRPNACPSKNAPAG